MKKRIATLFVALVLMFAMAMPVMAVDGLAGDVQPDVAVNRVMLVEDLDDGEECCMMTPFNGITCPHGNPHGQCWNLVFFSNCRHDNCPWGWWPCSCCGQLGSWRERCNGHRCSA